VLREFLLSFALCREGAFQSVVFYSCAAGEKIVSRRFPQIEDADFRRFFNLYFKTCENLRENSFNLRETVFAGVGQRPAGLVQMT
jgi:hypothetical protein